MVMDDYYRQMDKLNKLINPPAFSVMHKLSSSLLPFEKTISAIEKLGVKTIDFSFISAYKSQLSDISAFLRPTNTLLTAIEGSKAFSHAFSQSGIFEAITGISRNISAIEAVNKLYAILPIVQPFNYSVSFSDDGNITVDDEIVSKEEIFEIAKEFENSTIESLTVIQKIEKIKSKKWYLLVFVMWCVFHSIILDPIIDKALDEFRERAGINRIIEKIDIKKWADEILGFEKEQSIIIQAISSKTEIDAIFLFGSWAYGEPKPDSDLDIYLVIPDSDADICELNAEIRFALYKKLSFPLDLVIAKKSVFERRSKELTLENTIAKQGVRIYGK